MPLRPEVLGTIGLVVAALLALAIWLRLPRTLGSARVCERCGTRQPLPSRASALAREIYGHDRCTGCGHQLGRAGSPQ